MNERRHLESCLYSNTVYDRDFVVFQLNNFLFLFVLTPESCVFFSNHCVLSSVESKEEINLVLCVCAYVYVLVGCRKSRKLFLLCARSLGPFSSSPK